jgi:cellulose biosynthesis protein BcsQ
MLALAAVKKGLKTVIIDADLEAPSLVHLIKPLEEGPTWVDYLEEKTEDVSALPRKCNIEGLDAIFSPPPKIGRAFLSWKSKEWWQQALKRSMIAEQELHNLGYDLVVLDNQSGTSLNSVNNMVLADASVMVIRPATYGVGAAGDFIGELYRVLRDMKPRADFYMWNQVQIPTNEEEHDILDNFLNKWDNSLTGHGILYGGKIDHSPKLNLGLLGENPNLMNYFSEVKETINQLLGKIMSMKLEGL